MFPGLLLHILVYYRSLNVAFLSRSIMLVQRGRESLSLLLCIPDKVYKETNEHSTTNLTNHTHGKVLRFYIYISGIELTRKTSNR